MVRLLALFALLCAGCAALQTGEVAPAQAVVAAIEAGATVVDVRTDAEWAEGHVAGALHIPIAADDFRARVAELPRDEPVYLYCRSGMRSGRAVRILTELGFRDARNAGGLASLAAAGAPVAVPAR